MPKKARHFVNQTVVYDVRNRQLFEAALTERGLIERSFDEACKWFQVDVEADSPCDKALKEVSMSRKELK